MDIIDLALAEDIGEGDLTVRYFTDPTREGVGFIFPKDPCLLAGAEVAGEVFHRVSERLEVEILIPDGTSLAGGEEVVCISGNVGDILTAERTALNFIQRLSGVATRTHRFVEAIAGTGARILDTRKTTPGFRELEKAAVRVGGGTNHRSGLFDMVMVKDNHLAADAASRDGAGGVFGSARLREGIAALKREHPGVAVELEADRIDQVEAFLRLEGVDRILLDNMRLDELRGCVELVAGRVALEASGGVTLETVRGIAETGVDFISVGSLTHSATAVDFSLEIRGGPGS